MSAASLTWLVVVAASAAGLGWGCDRETPPIPAPLPSTSAASATQPGDPTLPAELEPKPGSAEASVTDAGVADAQPWTGPWLTVTKIAAAVYSGPEFDKKGKLGYVRSGGRVPVEATPVSQANCKQGWFKTADGGFICGNLGSLDADHPLVKFATRQPNLEDVLPYTYARNSKHGTPLYRSVPSREQMYQYEPYLSGAKAAKPKAAAARDDAGAIAAAASAARDDSDAGPDRRAAAPSASGRATTGTESAASASGRATTANEAAPSASGRATTGTEAAASDPVGEALADGGVAADSPAAPDEPETPWWQQDEVDDRLHEIKLDDLSHGADDVLARRMVKGFYVAIDRTFRWNDRTWYRTTKGLVAPADRFWQVAGSKFRGVEIDGTENRLPVGWVYGGRKQTTTYELEEDGAKLMPSGSIEHFGSVQLTGQQRSIRSQDYWETRAGTWVKRAHVRVTAPGDPPADLGPSERWVDVNLTEQTLVVFEGTRPIFATLVSTGKTSKVKEKDHRTPVGQWRVREKHVTTTMDGDGTAAGDLPYSIEDVPYAMYYHRSYAIHGAFWHRNFGVQMSHGCINLAPLDARRVFFLLEPRLPEGWHGAWAVDEHPGGWVVVHE